MTGFSRVRSRSARTDQQRSEARVRIHRRPQPVYREFPKLIDTQGVFPRVCAVCPQCQRIPDLRRPGFDPHPVHTESTGCPQGCPRGFPRLPTGHPQLWVVTHQGDPGRFGCPQSLGTTRSQPGDNCGDNWGQLWMNPGRLETIHGSPEPSTDPPPGLPTGRRTPRPARTSAVHTIHSPYYCYWFFISSKKEQNKNRRRTKLGTSRDSCRLVDKVKGRPR